MFSDKYNYSLNGIEHIITLNNNIKIDKSPLNDKILVSNKYIIKYINDLFDYHSIEYCFVGQSLLGIYIFNGVNIFNPLLEVCTLDSNFYKIKKLVQEIKDDGFDIIFYNNYIKISTIFFDNIKSSIYIYSIENENTDDLLKYNTINNNTIYHQFYDIFSIKKKVFEEFEVSVPNKIEKVLETYNYNLDYITFTREKNKNHNEIIENIETKSTLNTFIKENIKENIDKFISIINPFING
jgi:hypothetical protein